MVSRLGVSLIFAIILQNLTLAQRSVSQDITNTSGVFESTLYGGDEMRVEAKPQKPYWIDHNTMKQSIYAEGFQSVVKLQCLAGGEPQPETKWLKNGIPIKQATRNTSFKPYKEKPEKSLLIIPGMTESDQGNYSCLVENPHGILRHDFIVEYIDPLIPKPILTYKSPNQTVLEGMSANFTCEFKTDLTLYISWARPSRKALELFGENFNRSDPDNFELILDAKTEQEVTGENMILPDVQLTDSGIYFCIGRTNSGNSVDVIHLTVLNKTEAFSEKPENLSVPLGSNAIFSCKTHKSIREYSSWVKITNEEIKTLAEGTEIYRINNVTENDLGLYACVVEAGDFHVEHVVHLEAAEPTMTPTIASANKKVQALAVVVGIVFILLFATTIAIWRKFQRERVKKQRAIDNARAVTQWTKKVIIERQNVGPESPIVAPVIRIEKQNSTVNASNRSRLGSENTTLTTISEYELPLDPDWERPRSNLKLGSVLGEGAFGKVVKGELSGYHSPLILSTTVAVKMLKEGHTDNDMIDLVSEMDMMKMIGKHINIINLIGVCTQDGPLFVIVEYAQNGNLRDFLRKHNNFNEGYERPNSLRPSISEKHLISFARQVCKGMEYLHSMKCIHRDLAARNVLVSTDFIIKIADFGLARDVNKTDYYRKLSDGWLPIRWMAPEAIFRRTYTTKSDVWSFGILLWEIMTLGASPYPSIQSMERLFEMLGQGYRMERPSGCSEDVYSIMRNCWSSNPMLRPRFSELVTDLDRLLAMAKEVDYLDLGSTVDYSTCETILCQSIENDNSDQTLQGGLSASPTTSAWSASNFQSVVPPVSRPPLPPPDFVTYPEGFNPQNGNGHVNLTYNKMHDVTYKPLLTNNYWNNNDYQKQTSTFKPRPPLRTTPLQHPYVNHVQDAITPEDEEKVSLQLNEFKAEDEDYEQMFAKHLQSSNL